MNGAGEPPLTLQLPREVYAPGTNGSLFKYFPSTGSEYGAPSALFTSSNRSFGRAFDTINSPRGVRYCGLTTHTVSPISNGNFSNFSF